MALQVNDITAVINATANLVQGSSDYACCFWYQPLGQATSPDYLTAFALTDAGYTAWAGVFSDATVSDGGHEINADNGGGTSNTTNQIITAGQIAHIGYRRFGTTHQFMVNGFIVGTCTEDMSAVTFAELLLGNDRFSVLPAASLFWDFKEWTVSQSVGRIRREAALYGSVESLTFLNRFCPLLSDLLDDSGNGFDLAGAGNFDFVANPALPTNVQPVSATVVASLPFADAVVETYNLPLWYARTPDVGEVYNGAWGFGGLGTYTPVSSVWITNGTVEWPETIWQTIGPNVPIEFPVVPGQTYWVEFASQYEAAYGNQLDPVQILPGPTEVIDAPAVFITDDSFGYGAAITSIVDGHVYQFRGSSRSVADGYPASENGESLILGSGRFMLLASFSADNPQAKIYDGGDLALLTETDLGADQFNRISSNFVDMFYVGFGIVAPDNAYVYRVSEDGVLDPTVIGPLGINALAFAEPNADETILYFAQIGTGGGGGEPVQQWDLINNVALPDLTGPLDAISANAIALPDGLVITAIIGGIGAVYKLDTAGNVVWSLPTAGINPDYHSFHFYPHVDYPDSFWVVMHVGNATSLFTRLDSATGAVLDQYSHRTFLTGAYEGAETATPDADFGPATSCAYVLLTSAPTPPGCPALLGQPRTDGAPYVPFTGQ